ncbi:MAG: RNA ligase family protein [Paraclostridium sp.]
MERSLAHIEIITDLSPIKGADKIEVATVLGWQCVVKKEEFKVGQKIIYIEVDSVLPDKPEYEFLRDRKFRIKTIKLKGQISQGLVIPLPINWDTKSVGLDVTKDLGIIKYLSPSEKEESRKIDIESSRLKKFMMRYSWFRRIFLSRKQKEGFPYWVSKTDEERIQNIPSILETFKDVDVYVTEKIDYQSATFTGKMIPKFNGLLGKLFPLKEYKFIVCSRNLQNNNKNSLYWKIAQKYNIEQILKENPNLTIQGEQGDTTVQGNKYELNSPHMWVFNIIDHEKNYHFDRDEMVQFCSKYSLDIVPLLYKRKLGECGNSVEELVNFSKGKSLINSKINREGIVIRCIENGKKILSFKVINPDFLLTYEE